MLLNLFYNRYVLYKNEFFFFLIYVFRAFLIHFHTCSQIIFKKCIQLLLLFFFIFHIWNQIRNFFFFRKLLFLSFLLGPIVRPPGKEEKGRGYKSHLRMYHRFRDEIWEMGEFQKINRRYEEFFCSFTSF